MRAHINYVTKVEFLSAFKETFFASVTEENIRGGFKGLGLMPLDPESVLSKLDIKFRTLIPSAPPSAPTNLWVSKTPQTAFEASS
jgi:hypothetical protein